MAEQTEMDFRDKEREFLERMSMCRDMEGEELAALNRAAHKNLFLKNIDCNVIETNSIDFLLDYMEHGNWCWGDGIRYMDDLAFVEQASDEWATFKYDPDMGSWATTERMGSFESISFRHIMETQGRESASNLVANLQMATLEQCAKLEYSLTSYSRLCAWDMRGHIFTTDMHSHEVTSTNSYWKGKMHGGNVHVEVRGTDDGKWQARLSPVSNADVSLIREIPGTVIMSGYDTPRDAADAAVVAAICAEQRADVKRTGAWQPNQELIEVMGQKLYGLSATDEEIASVGKRLAGGPTSRWSVIEQALQEQVRVNEGNSDHYKRDIQNTLEIAHTIDSAVTKAERQAEGRSLPDRDYSVGDFTHAPSAMEEGQDIEVTREASEER